MMYSAYRGFPGGSDGKEPAQQCREPKRGVLDPQVERPPGGGHSNPPQNSCLENPIDRGAWQAIVHRITKELDIEQQTGSKSGKEYVKAVYCHSAYITCRIHHAKCQLDEAQAGNKIDGRSINNLRYADDTILMAESEEELKSLLMKVKEESEKAGLKLNIRKMKIMASGPITSWQIDVETETDFIFWGSKITADGDCSPEIKRHLLLGRKAMTNLDSILKSRDVTLPTKVHLVKAMVFPVVMYGCDSWTIKKAEH